MISEDNRRSRPDARPMTKMPARHWIASFFILVTTAIAACSSPGSDADDQAQVETATRTQPILNGGLADPWQFTAGDRRGFATVRIQNTSYTGCAVPDPTATGILLENWIVLTAAHVVADVPGCDFPQSPYTAAQPGDIWVYSADTPKTTRSPTCPADACAHPAPSGIVINPSSDTALIFLQTRIRGTEGVTFGHFVPIFPFDQARYLNDAVWCSGYGFSVCNDANSGRDLRFGLARVEQGHLSLDTMLLLTPFNNQLPSSGDSGGPCWSEHNGETYPLSVLGVISSGLGCQNIVALPPPTFRHWVRTQIASRKPTTTNTFSSSADIAWWAAYNPPNTTTNWTINGGWLSETSNAGATEPDGPMRFAVLEIHENADISVKVRSSDNDGAGIVFRYVDNQNYYLFYANATKNIARFYKRRSGVFSLMKEGPTALVWSNTTPVTLRVELRGANFRGFVNGNEVVNVTETAATRSPMGYVGLFKWRLENALFDDFLVVPKPPTSDATWPITG